MNKDNSMRQLSLTLLLLLTPLVYADNAANYRDNFMNNCVDQNDDSQAKALCQCVFNKWLDQLPSKTDPRAITATKLIANVAGDYLPSEIQQAAIYMQNMQDISMQCADNVMGAIHVGGDNTVGNDVPTPNDDTQHTNTNTNTNTNKRGLFGAVVGWAGQKAGLPDTVNDAAADKADANEDSIKAKLNPFKSRFNPFKKDKEE